MGSQGKNWCFTIHFNHRDIELAEIQLMNIQTNCRDFDSSCGVAQLELCPKTGSLHMQGFVMFNKNIRFERLKETFTALADVRPAHIELMKGDYWSNEAYCTKFTTRAPGTDPHYWGTPPLQKQQGKRNDVLEATQFLAAQPSHLAPAAKLRRLAKSQEHSSTFVRLHRGLSEYAQYLEEREPTEDPVWKPWQTHLREQLAQIPDRRTIYWVYDAIGKQGKSQLVLWYVSREMGVCLDGKLHDMAYLYQKERIAFFDIPRAGSEHCDHLYRMGENLKNGFLNSTKYTPCVKTFAPPHVVYMSNSPPPDGAWSKDRLVTYVLSAEGFEVHQTQQSFHSHSTASESTAAPICPDISSTVNPFLSLTIPQMDELSQE